MEPSFETSFVPKQPLLRVEGIPHRSEPINLAVILAVIVLLVTIVVSIGMFFYKRTIDAEVLTARQDLDRAEELLDIEMIKNFELVAGRIDVAKGLLHDHRAFSTILDFLEKGIAQNVGLTSLSYSQDASVIRLVVSGQSPSYDATYFQQETWRKMTPLVLSADITQVSLDEKTGVVTFDAGIILDFSLTTYAELLKAKEKLPADSDAPTTALPKSPSTLPSSVTSSGTTLP